VLRTVWGKRNGDDAAFHKLATSNEKDEWLGVLLFGVHIFSRCVYCDLSCNKYHSAQVKNYLSLYFIKHSSHHDIFQISDINDVLCFIFYVSICYTTSFLFKGKRIYEI
jgi:hypothetical protein